jgi:small-conductance mechanosensitive channel
MCCLLLIGTLASTQHVLSQENTAKFLDQPAILQFINQSVTWYQRTAIERQVATTSADLLFATDNRLMAEQVIRLSFEFARNAGPLVGKEGPSELPSTPGGDRYQRLTQTQAQLDAQAKQIRSQLDALRQKRETAPARERKALDSAIGEVQSELDLISARREVLNSMLQFLGGASEPGDLASQIETLERSVPGIVTGNQTANAANSTAAASVVSTPAVAFEPSGIWGILRELFRLSRKIEAINENQRETDALKQAVQQIQAPLVERLKAMVRQSDSFVSQTDVQDPAVKAQQKATLVALTAQYKQISAALLPLTKEAILLDVYSKNLGNWRASVRADYSTDLKSLLVRVIGLGVLLGLVLGAFELWRKAIFHYIPDMRRRYQFLLLRRIALWSVITLIVTFGFVSELGSLATFAGLMTAGVAVALQNVILSVVGYFLLIGKYGVRVGDRIQVAGVSGEVVDVGLLRLHVMELVGSVADAQPTGRIAAFSNSIVFQPSPGLFKQVPGTSFAWHEISLTLAPDSDYRTVEHRMLSAVNAAFRDYQKSLEGLRRQMERSLASVTVGSLEPKVRFRLSQTGLEVLVRFPVELNNAAEMDDHVTRELLRAIEIDPKLKIVGADVPTIRLTTDAPASGQAVAPAK